MFKEPLTVSVPADWVNTLPDELLTNESPLSMVKLPLLLTLVLKVTVDVPETSIRKPAPEATVSTPDG